MLVEVLNLKKYFTVKALLRKSSSCVRAVDNVSFSIAEKETFALVGESGCGKTTLGRTILRLIEPTSGEIYFERKNILRLSKEELRVLRQKMQIVFQDPEAALDPRIPVGKAVAEPLIIHKLASSEVIEKNVNELFEKVGLEKQHLDKYPHEFSGGQKQRICIARALALKPKFLVLDEPTSALDVSVQAQILNLLMDLQKYYGLTYLFITHNLGIVRNIADRIAVMYGGKFIESGTTDEIFSNPLHPYTQALFSSIPSADIAQRARVILKGESPNLISPPKGCKFYTRCEHAKPICKEMEPTLSAMGDHKVACWMY
ncbi:MAG: ATP-binding cassette domain-containing protein [Candidatus Thermoplasmatota archaeon]|nr:ATP-binding cassette domain-containing protein [Candidatus Thermoplasmatota archaeon]